MKTGWKSLIVAGAVLIILSGQVMAQPWGGGPGRGQGMGWRPQGPGPMGTGPVGPGGPQGPGGASGPSGMRPGGRGAWAPGGAGQGLFPRALLGRLNLTEGQKDNIRDILTDEQVQQLEQMKDRTGQFRQRNGDPQLGSAFRGPRGRRPQGTWGRGGEMGPGFGRGRQGRGGRGCFGQSFRGGPGLGRGQQGYAPVGPGGRGRFGQSFRGGPGFGRGQQGDAPAGPGGHGRFGQSFRGGPGFSAGGSRAIHQPGREPVRDAATGNGR